MPRQTWIMGSEDHDEDFVDPASGNFYQVGNITDAVEAESRTNAEGGSVIWNDAPMDDSPYEVEPGQKFVIGEFEIDSQGVQYQPKGRNDD